MGFWSELFAFGAARAALNATAPPSVVIENPDYVVKGMKPSGLNSWKVWIGKRAEGGRGTQYKIGRNTVSFNGNFGNAKVYWA